MNFLVCKTYEDRRTKPLISYLERQMPKEWDYFLIGGYDGDGITRLSESDDYLSGIDKTMNIFTHHDPSSYDWFFIGDDDTFVNMRLMQMFVSDFEPPFHTITGHVDLADDRVLGRFYHAHGGSGILMDSKTFALMAKYAPNSRRHEKHGDVSLALCAWYANMDHGERIEFFNHPLMRSPHTPIQILDPKASMTIHMKDRESFESLEQRMLA